MAPPKDFIQRHLADTLESVDFLLDVERLQKGKVRDIFTKNGQRIMVATDRQSAFDRILAAVPFKGQVLNRISQFWFEQTQDICPNHFVAMPDPNVTIAKNAKVFPIEVVVRGFLTGSTDTAVWTHYRDGVRDFCGVRLPDGMKKNDAFPKPIITPTTKDKDHDKPICKDEIIAQGRATAQQWDEICDKALRIFKRGQEICAENGLILVDTKFEFGLDENGKIMLVDEVLTPDSSRFWLQETFDERIASGQEPDNFDKEFLRLWFVEHCDPYRDKVLPKAPEDLIVELSSRYIWAFEKITGQSFHPTLGDPTLLARIEKNLQRFFEK